MRIDGSGAIAVTRPLRDPSRLIGQPGVRPAGGITTPPVFYALVGLVEVIVAAWCVPLVILLLGLPVVLFVRLILEMAERL